MGRVGVWVGVVVLTITVMAGQAMVAQAPKPAPKADAKTLKNPVAATPASVSAGQQLYQKYCRFCHGATGKGDSPSAPKNIKPADLTDDTWAHGSTDADIFTVIQEGTPPNFEMKGLKGKLTEQDTWNLVNYVRSLGASAKP
jgi:mono/diheme cytochrome c family protein